MLKYVKLLNPHGQEGSLSPTGHSQTLAVPGGPALGLEPWGSWGRFVVYKGGEIQFWRCQRWSFECLDDAGWVPWDPKGSHGGPMGVPWVAREFTKLGPPKDLLRG